MKETNYVKGDREQVIKRFSQIHSINLRCPNEDAGVKCFKTTLISLLNAYVNEHGNFENIPVSDVTNAFFYTTKFCKEHNIDTEKLYILMGCIQSFTNLKMISLEFINDYGLNEAYDKIKENNISNDEKIEILKKIYDIKVLKFYLSDMFSQEIIDMFNKCMMHNGLISNSYLKREFYMNFDYDGYISFMDMFLNNNAIKLESMDKNIIDYFRLFPTFVCDQKPIIIVVTNYRGI